MDRARDSDLCRFCWRHPETNGNKTFVNILNTKVDRVELRKIVLDLLTVKVDECDLLPKIICQWCYKFLVKWYKSDRKLKRVEKIQNKYHIAPKYSSDHAKSSAKKKKRLAVLQQRLRKKTTENQLIMLNILEKMIELEKQEETQNPPKSVTTRHDIGPIDPDEPRYCICNQVEYGRMIACDNEECPYKWFHYDCMNIVNTPKGTWYCQHCVVASVQ